MLISGIFMWNMSAGHWVVYHNSEAHLDNFQKFSNCLICLFCAMSIFSYKIEDVGN